MCAASLDSTKVTRIPIKIPQNAWNEVELSPVQSAPPQFDVPACNGWREATQLSFCVGAGPLKCARCVGALKGRAVSKTNGIMGRMCSRRDLMTEGWPFEMWWCDATFESTTVWLVQISITDAPPASLCRKVFIILHIFVLYHRVPDWSFNNVLNWTPPRAFLPNYIQTLAAIICKTELISHLVWSNIWFHCCRF